MSNIFYFIALFPIVWEMTCISETKRVHLFKKRMKAKKGGELTSTEATLGMLVAMYVAWCFIGFFSSQWMIFLFLLLTSMIPKGKIWMKKIDAVLSLLILIFILINRYHLKIDIMELLF